MRSSNGGLSLMLKVEDGFAKLLLVKAGEIEAERQRQILRARMEEERRRRWEAAVQNAVKELEKYGNLIKQAAPYSENMEVGISVHKHLLSSLYKQCESRPEYMARETRKYRELLEEDLRKAKARAEEERRRREEKALQNQAILLALILRGKIEDQLKKISDAFYDMRMMNLTNLIVEKVWVAYYKSKGYEVNSLSEVENIVKKEAIERIRKQFKEDNKYNPYILFL
jgi:hypothetical protein